MYRQTSAFWISRSSVSAPGSGRVTKAIGRSEIWCLVVYLGKPLEINKVEQVHGSNKIGKQISYDANIRIIDEGFKSSEYLDLVSICDKIAY